MPIEKLPEQFNQIVAAVERANSQGKSQTITLNGITVTVPPGSNPAQKYARWWITYDECRRR